MPPRTPGEAIKKIPILDGIIYNPPEKTFPSLGSDWFILFMRSIVTILRTNQSPNKEMLSLIGKKYPTEKVCFYSGQAGILRNIVFSNTWHSEESLLRATL